MKTEQKENKQKQAVVLGATGAMGSAVVRKLVEKKQPVRAVTRNAEYARKLFEGTAVEIVQADMLSLEQTRKAVAGAEHVYNCIGIPYTKWLKLFPKINKNVIEAVAETKALLIYADNLYMYAPINGEEITEEHPQNTTSKKGILRKELAEELLRQQEMGRIKVVIVRMGDFYGPNVVNGFTDKLFPNALAGKAASWIGDLDKKHSLIYIEDAAEGLVLTGQHPELTGKVWHLEGAEALTGREFITMINKQLHQEPKVKSLTKRTILILSPIVPIVREIKELLGQWEKPFVIDGTRFKEATGRSDYTPHEEAIQETLEWFKKNYSKT